MSSRKLATRKSPAESATSFSVGTVKKGLNGMKWEIVANKNNVKRWKQVSQNKETKGNKKEKTRKVKSSKSPLSENHRGSTGSFLIHDNGGRPWKVVVSKDLVEVYTYTDKAANNYDKLVWKCNNPLKVWIGVDESEPKFLGNSIVVQLTKTKLVSIGSNIYQFDLIDKNEIITEYSSRVGNSDVPYPFLVTNKYVYFTIENKYADREKFGNFFEDPYEILYDKSSKVNAKSYKTKELVKRKWR